MKFKELLFGTAGIPLSTVPSNTENGISRVRELGLGAMELEFVKGVHVKKEKTAGVREVAEKEKIVLTCHGSYYINLNALEKEKLGASKERILQAAKIANACGAWSLTFHAAYYMKLEKEKVFENVKKGLKGIVDKLRDEGNGIWIRPETTGKRSQFGELEEILKLSEEVEGVMPCIDFSHLHARSNGKNNSYEEFAQILGQVEESLGREGLNNMHCHVAGIEYGEKGERNHLNLQDSDLKYGELCKALKEFKCKGIVISESPNIEEDALLLQKSYNSVK